MTEISRFKVERVVSGTHGQLFNVVFVKKDGKKRAMLCQIIPEKENAKRPSPAKVSNDYMLVRDMILYRKAIADGFDHDQATDRSYRLVNLATIRTLKVAGESYTVVD